MALISPQGWGLVWERVSLLRCAPPGASCGFRLGQVENGAYLGVGRRQCPQFAGLENVQPLVDVVLAANGEPPPRSFADARRSLLTDEHRTKRLAVGLGQDNLGHSSPYQLREHRFKTPCPHASRVSCNELLGNGESRSRHKTESQSSEVGHHPG